MRLFTAVNFSGEVKEILAERCREIKKHTVRSNFTEKNNFHMTLVFIGECNSAQADHVLEAAEKSAREIKESYAGKITDAVEAEIAGLGSFLRGGEHLVWAGLKSDPVNIFSDLHRRLIINLQACGIKTADSRFTPHITLARRVIFREMNSTEIDFAPVRTELKSLCVMESINMGRIYNSIYGVDFV